MAKIISRLRGGPKDFSVINYNERLWPWMRRFVWLWVRMGRWALLFMAVAGPAAHQWAPSYAFGSGCFWLIYSPVCGLFFNWAHFADAGEGHYYLNTGLLPRWAQRSRFWIDRF